MSHSPRLTLIALLIAAVAVSAVGVGLITVAGVDAAWRAGAEESAGAPSQSTGEATNSEPLAGPTLAAPANPQSITASGPWLLGWALFDRQTATVTGSPNSATVRSTVESMIKPWIAADYLRRLAEKKPPTDPAAQAKQTKKLNEEILPQLTLMIVDSHDPMAEKYFQLGGGDAVIRRLSSICGLTRVTIKPTLWSWTQMTPRDAAAYGRCLADGRAAGPQWTTWLLNTMKSVRGGVRDQFSGEKQGGRWGIIDGLPPALAAETSIKNGWTSYRDGWHVNCLAVHADWTLAVMMRTGRGLQNGANACKSIAAALVVDP